MARVWPRAMRWFTRAAWDSVEGDLNAAARAYRRNLNHIWPRLPEAMRAVARLDLHDAWFRSNSVLEVERPLQLKIAYSAGQGGHGTLLLRYHEWSLVGVDHQKAATWLAATVILRDEVDLVDGRLEHRFLLHPGGELGFRFASVDVELVPPERTRQLSEEERDATPEFDPADIEPPPGLAPVSAAAWCGDLDELRELLATGADPSEANDDGWSALMWACFRGQRDAVELLLRAGAECRDPPDPEERTLLGSVYDVEIFDLLVAHGCELNARTADAALSWNLPDCDVAIVERLLAAGADPNRNYNYGDGDTPLHFAVAGRQRKGSSVGLVARLLAAGADPNRSTKCGDTPLHLAADSEEPEVVAALLAAGADPTVRDEDGSTAADIASEAGRVHVAEMLRKAPRPPK